MRYKMFWNNLPAALPYVREKYLGLFPYLRLWS